MAKRKIKPGTEHGNILAEVNDAIKQCRVNQLDDRRVARSILSQIPGLQNIDQVLADMDEVFSDNKSRRMSEIEAVRGARILMKAYEAGLIGPQHKEGE